MNNYYFYIRFSFFRSLKNPSKPLNPMFKHFFGTSFRTQLLVLLIAEFPFFV